MRLLNKTAHHAGWTLGFQPDGRELLVVAAKATFSIPGNGEPPALAGSSSTTDGGRCIHWRPRIVIDAV